jgi:putative redox protein
MPEVVVTNEPSLGSLVQRIQSGVHVFYADEPPPAGGDRWPDPYALLLAALGTCTAMTLSMYAAHKSLNLERVKVRLTYNRIHAEDCEACENSTGWAHRIDIELTLDGDLSEQERRRLLQIAERCPVHRTLVDEKEIRTTLAG